jgi:hypothetical protein
MYTQQDLDVLVGFLGHYNDLKYGSLRDVLQQTLPPAAKKASFTTSSSGKSSSFRINKQQQIYAFHVTNVDVLQQIARIRIIIMATATKFALYVVISGTLVPIV